MSTRSLHGIGTSTTTTTTSSSSPYLNRGLQIVGLFFFINGVYVAFFSENIFTTFGYYFVVIAAICGVLSQIISPETPLIPAELQRAIGQLIRRPDSTRTTRTTRSHQRHSGRKKTFDIRRYLRPVVQAVERIDVGRFTSRGKGRDRL